MTIQNFKLSNSGYGGLYLPDDDQAKMVFLLPPESETLPEKISLSDSWNDFSEGCYVFLPDPLPEIDQVAFATAAWIFLSEPTRRRHHPPDVTLPHIGLYYSPRFAWFENPEQAEFGLRGQSISLYQYKDKDDEDFEWRNDRLVTCNFGNYSLEIVKNCSIILNADGSGFEFSPQSGFENTLMTPKGPLSVDVTLTIGGRHTGAFIFDVDNIGDFILKIQPEIRYFFKDTTVPFLGNDFGVISQRYPILSQTVDDWTDVIPNTNSLLRLHLLKPMKDQEFDLSGPLKGVELPSYFHTNLGHPITLTPLEGESWLVFVPRPDYARNETGSVNYYATLKGNFEINTTSASANLICGLSGAEYINLPSNKQNILTFVPGNPAFAPTFKFDQTQEEDTGNGEKLTDLATTAWVYVSQRDLEAASDGTSSSHPIYFAQPDQAVLYQPFEQGDTGDFLEYMEVPAVALPPQPDSKHPTLALPIAPYGQVDPDEIEHYQKFEAGLLNSLRRSLIHQFSTTDKPLIETKETTSAPRVGTTPQGLLATFSGDFEEINSLVLAHDSAGNNFDFKDISRGDPLRSALQSSQLFLVITKPESIRDHFHNDVENDNYATLLQIAEWKFDLDPDKWKKYQTLLIFKFHNLAMQELATSTHSWTLAEEFSDNPEVDSFRLDMLIQDALERVPLEENPGANQQESENYRQLAEAARNPNWTGILALNVPVPDGGLPDAIAGLASGIDPNRFFAQFVGIESSTVHLTGGKLEIQESSLFGLIDYVDSGGTVASGSDYNFYVSKLNVLFENSLVKHFSGEVVVTMDKLFSEETLLKDSLSGRNEIYLVGRCESHDGRNTYSFSSGTTSKFELRNSDILNEVEIVKAQFSTDPPAEATGFKTDDTVTSRFSFWGRLDFKKLEVFDILSFGTEPGSASEGGMRFSNLQLVTTFTWGEGTTKDFTFRAGSMIFDLGKSQARTDSLFAKFPLKLTGLLESDGSKTPDSLGYMPVRTPAKGEKPKNEETWYGLVFDLNLGSAGALAGKAGIVVSLLATWKPGAGSNVYTGLRLPGSSGGKQEIPIQGILKIAFKSIEFQVMDTGNVSYLLKLRNIVLKFMTLELPPNAQSEIIIFGDPQGRASNKDTLAWYAAYAKGQNPQDHKKQSNSLISG